MVGGNQEPPKYSLASVYGRRRSRSRNNNNILDYWSCTNRKPNSWGEGGSTCISRIHADDRDLPPVDKVENWLFYRHFLRYPGNEHPIHGHRGKILGCISVGKTLGWAVFQDKEWCVLNGKYFFLHLFPFFLLLSTLFDNGRRSNS